MNAIEVEGAGKRYRQYRDRGMLLKRLLMPHRVRDHHDIWALRDVNFTVEEGETFGVIGRNGSGKTTLLQILSGVTAPTEGRVRVVGRVAPLIGIGVGFNDELTGRENIRVNGRILGMTSEQIEDRYDDIVEFSEIEDFIDVPVKFYSSGMFLRLAFSVAIHTDPDIMAVDEILAVGDVSFQSKCFDRMRELRASGATVVVVTHNLHVLQRMAERTMVLDEGRVVMDGPTEEAINVYHEVMQEHQERRDQPTFVPEELSSPVRHRTARIRTSIVGRDGASTFQVRPGEPLRVRAEVEFDEEVEGPYLGLAVERGGSVLFAAANDPHGYQEVHGPGRPLHGEVVLDSAPLLTGTYRVLMIVKSTDSPDPLAASTPLMFHVATDAPSVGSVNLWPEFRLEGQPVKPARTSLLGDRHDEG